MYIWRVWNYFEAPFVWFINLFIEVIIQLHLWLKIKKGLLVNLVFKVPLVPSIIENVKEVLICALSMGPIPRHVSFIMDGNRRYARSQKLPIKKGHEAGGITLLTLVYICKRIGVRCVSCYAFSIENFKRPKEEVDTLMELFSIKLDEFATRANDYKDPLYGSKLKIVGDRTLLSKEIREKIRVVETLTSKGKLFTLYVCLPYTSRNDIHHSMCKNIVNSLQNKNNEKKIDITCRSLSEQMYFDGFSNKCDVVIRTSGHKRLSDYMLWQGHENTTIEFTDSLWPDFAFLEMYIMLLKWSFFQNFQNYKDLKYMSKDGLRSGCTSLFNKQANVNYFDLPQPPQSVAVAEKK